VLAQPHVVTRLQPRSTLPNQDGAPGYELPVESLDAQPLRVGIAAVARTSQSLFVCHFSSWCAGRTLFRCLVRTGCRSPFEDPAAIGTGPRENHESGTRLVAPASAHGAHYIMISLMRTSLNAWRWPRVRRYCFLRLYFKTRTLADRALRRIVAVTFAFSTRGEPTSNFSLRTAQTWLNSTVVPGSPLSLSTRMTSPGETLYSLPPVRKIAYID